MIKLNAWLKRYSMPCMWASGLLIVSAMIFSHLLDLKILVSICYLAAFLLSGFPIACRAVQALRFQTVSIELLVTIAAVGACVIGEFNEAGVVTFLFQFGSFLEQKTMKKTRSAIKSLTEMAPTAAWKITDFNEDGTYEVEEIDADEVEIDDLLLVKAGNQIASDGIVVKGDGYASEASITGESLPKHKTVGDPLYAGTFLDNGTVQMRATKVGEDTTFAKIIELVEEAQDAKSPVERFIDRFARYYTPAVIGISALVLLFTRNLDTAITVLVLACPGALVIGAPIANVAGIGRGAREGILLKGGDSIHTFSKTDTIVFDKTGTLTVGVPKVTIQKNYSVEDPTQVLKLAASVEQASDHPLAQAVVSYAKDTLSQNFVPYETDSVQTFPGFGLEAVIHGHHILIGSRKLMEQHQAPLSERVLYDLEEVQNHGASIVLISIDNQLKMLFGISDQPRPDAAIAMEQMKKSGTTDLLMLTGDNRSTAAAISSQLGITNFRAELLPEDKLSVIKELQTSGKTVTFVGDGINDSPALAAADTGIAMGSGTDVAVENSDVVLIKSDLASLVTSLRLAKKTTRILYENIAIAVGTVLLLLIGLFAGYIHMALGMLIHEASILVVIFNAMRLLIPARTRKE